MTNATANVTVEPTNTLSWVTEYRDGGGFGFINFYPGLLSASYKDEDRLSWNGWDPLLLAEASFALANVFSFLGIMRSMVILGKSYDLIALRPYFDLQPESFMQNIGYTFHTHTPLQCPDTVSVRRYWHD